MNFKKIAFCIITLGMGTSYMGGLTPRAYISPTTPRFELKQEEISIKESFQLIDMEKKYDSYIEKKKEEKKKKEEEAKRKREKEAKRKREKEAREKLRKKEQASKKPHFNPYNISEPSNLSREQISKILKGTRLQSLSNAYYWYEQKYKVNAFFMIALTAEESGWGKSRLAITHNNLSGHKSSNGWKYYDSWGDCLEESFRLIGEEYVSPKGKYYVGGNIYDINKVYCPDSNNWSRNIVNIVNGTLKNKLK